ncbi:tryptophan 2,3-dioxygenase [Peristeroidobacter soli]|jgi:tryptophan 2,3-dioxygenase|uniref:tryptophan 2,3-dioxygenase n=1 Tax=Peristeroidobacter soli TaxID=2497877 RepID=UPI00101BBFAA|nr:tryptophan 2,3-dioxygenase family protein [Peristeroidobacter soli]
MPNADQSPVTYASYLRLDALLDQQAPASDSHDEMLFILIHQASELWLKLCLHELRAARISIAGDQLRSAFKMLSRVAGVQKQLIHSWDVLGTMTPADYLSFRDRLGTSSGFQSQQYRLIEFMLGNKSAAHVERFRDQDSAYRSLQQALNEPSIYDEALRALQRHGLDIPSSYISRDFSQPYEPSREVEIAWSKVYRNTERYWELYELAEKLVDLEDRFQLWRYAHLRTVERIIGRKPGTGGTPGVPYLAKVIEQRFFPELFSVRTAL